MELLHFMWEGVSALIALEADDHDTLGSGRPRDAVVLGPAEPQYPVAASGSGVPRWKRPLVRNTPKPK